MKTEETRVLARGLNPPGPLLLAKKKLAGLESGGVLRVIVSSEEAADELVDYFLETGLRVEIDNAGEDIHVIVYSAETGAEI
jgi:TusA-related sulfurtransferase